MRGWKRQSHTWEGGNHQSHHRKVKTMESLQEVRNHGVTMGKVGTKRVIMGM